MKVKVTKSFSSVAKASDLHPKFFKPGDIAEDYAAEVAIAEGWGEKIDEDTDGDHAALAAGAAAAAAFGAGVAPPANDPAPLTKARIASPYSGPDHTGEQVKFAEGAVVEGEIAEFLIAQGVALEVHPDKKPAASKAKGRAPENK
jgi:hypothetical protein